MIYDAFPEAFFPISQEVNKDYCSRIEIGEYNAKKSSVIICGLARNIEANFFYLQKRIEKIGSYFNNYKVFFYENDSSDNTQNLLKKWSNENNSINYKSEKLEKIKHEQDYSLQRRIDMAYYRNQYLKYIQNMNFDYVIVIDTDIVGGWSYEGILHSLSYDFDVIAGNSIICRIRNNSFEQLYYDAWAFRALGHPNKHEDEEINVLKFAKGSNPFKVDSAFGGMAIYRRDILTSGKYMYTEKDCDHVTIHEQIKRDNYDIYVNPSLISLYSPSLYCV